MIATARTAGVPVIDTTPNSRRRADSRHPANNCRFAE
jgi:hypothetical protein